MLPRLALLPALTALTTLTGCGDTVISIATDGRIEISVTTTGSDLDLDGFSVSVDGGTQQFLQTGSGVTLTGLSEGTHSVFLSGLAENCHVDGSNPRPVVVGGDGRAAVSFSVVCVPATTGGFTILVTTVGQPADPDGYVLALAGAPLRAIGTSASETFTGLSAGRHLVTLKGVAFGCALDGGNPQPLTVVPGKTVLVRLTVTCGTAR
jgi:mRNA-degrading endonuclease toxin of MazEF toxin-antitoxin module